MTDSINLVAVYVANAMGILLCLMLLVGNKWKMYGSKKEKTYTKILIATALISCIMDPIAFSFDGKPGIFNFILVYVGNFWLFFSNMIIGPVWLFICSDHILGKITKTQKWIIRVLFAFGLLALIVNFFYPVVFSIDPKTNVYSRGPFFFLYSVIEGILILEGVFLYIVAKIRGGVLKFFPVIQFVIPVLLGVSFQFAFYGLSLVWPSLTISITGLLLCLQNEVVFRDSLTGLFNRSYLDNLKEEIQKKKSGHISAVMLDLNGFKGINDMYSHAEGDSALIATAGILRAAVGNLGSTIRYAGDEFILILNTQDKEIVENVIQNIREEFDLYNRTSEKYYTLSASIGYSFLDLKEQTVNELMEEIDTKMYEDKKRFYASQEN